MGVWSINHDITHYNITLAQTYPNFPEIHPHLQRHNSVRLHPNAHLHQMKLPKDFVIYDMDVGCSLQGVWSLNHAITTSLGLRPTPIFVKSTPDLQRRNSVRVHPYTHQQHIKVLKHFVYIWYRCGVQSTGVWRPWHYNITRAQTYPSYLKIAQA